MISDTMADSVLTHVKASDISSLVGRLQGVGPGAVFDVLAAELAVPGLRTLERGEVPTGGVLTSGLVAPVGSAWPYLVAEIPGLGTTWIEREQIRINICVIPLALDRDGSGLWGAAAAAVWMRAIAAAAEAKQIHVQRHCRFVFASCEAAVQAYVEKTGSFGMVMSGLECALRSSQPAGRLRAELATGGPKGESFVHALLADRLAAEKMTPTPGGEEPSPLALAPLGFPFARVHGLIPGAPADGDLLAFSRALLRSLAFLVCDLPLAEGKAFAQPLIAAAANAMRAEPAKAKAHYARLQGQLDNLGAMLWRGPWWITPAEVMEGYRREGKLIDGLYWPRSALEMFLEAEDAQLRALLPPAGARSAPAVPTTSEQKRAARLFPSRRTRGRIGFGGLDGRADRAALRRIGIADPAQVPPWMERLVHLAGGKKSALDLHGLLARQGFAVELGQIVAALRLLAKHKRMVFEPIVTPAAIVRALRAVGIKSGDIVVAHTGYTAYGHIPGGPVAVIRAFQKVLGPKGTLCLPTHSAGGLGGPPFEYATTPAGTGSIPNALLALPGTIRTNHPTHSVGVLGAHAKALTDGVDVTIPVFGRDGFWGRFNAMGGKVVMFCGNNGPNTFLHGVDYWAGAALPDYLAHVIENGQRREVRVLGMPFHADSFKHIYKVAYAEGLVLEAPLGKAKVYGMAAQEMTRVGLKVVGENVRLAICPDCPCQYCKHLARVAASQGR